MRSREFAILSVLKNKAKGIWSTLGQHFVENISLFKSFHVLEACDIG